MAEYKWTINKLDCHTLKNGLENVAYNVHWTYSLIDEEEVSISGVTGIGSPSTENFLEFNQLTEYIVIGWINNIMNIEKMQEDLTTKLADKISPKVVTLQLVKHIV